jgi:DNA-binding CsgD family transcriptional regulator
LRRAADEARAGNARVVVVDGEPGIGKTRLVAHLLAELRGSGDLVVSCHGVNLAGGEFAYGGAAEILRDLTRQLGESAVREAAGPHAQRLGVLHPAFANQRDGDAPTAVDRAVLFGAVHAAFLGLMQDRMVCLVVDDLQWVDASSRALIDYLALVSASAPLLLVCTVRSTPHDADPIVSELADLSRAPGAQAITLGPLPPEAVETFVRAALGDDVTPEIVERVQVASEGVPLYVEHLLEPGEQAGSTFLRVNLAARLTGLDEDTARFLLAAATGAGHSFEDLVAAVSDLDPDRAARARADAAARGLLAGTDHGQVRFHHALLRDAVLDGAPAARLIECHRRWATSLERTPRALPAAERLTALAQHWHACRQEDRALRASVEAARAAFDRGGLVEAATWFDRAMRLWDRVPDPEMITGLDRHSLLVRTLRSHFGQATDAAYLRIIDLCRAELDRSQDDWVTSLYLRLRIAWFTRLTQGVGHEVLPPDQVQATAEALLAEHHHPLAALCGTYLIQEYPAAVPWSLVEQMGERALSEVEQRGDLGELLSHLCWEGYVATTRGQAAQALASGRRIIELTAHGPPPAPPVMINTLINMGEVGHFAEALAWFDSLVDLSSPSDAMLWASVAEDLVEGLYAAGDWDRSDRVAQDVLASDVEPLTAGINWAIRTRIAASRGEVEAAREYLSRTLAVLPRLGDPWAPLMAAHPAATAAAEVAILDGAPERALEHLLLALQAPDTVERSDLAAEILVLAARVVRVLRDVPAGTFERIREVSEQLHKLGDLGVAWSGEVAALLADAEGHPTPSERWRAVVAAWERVGHPFDALQARTQLAGALLREGARPAAAQVIAEALQLADELGAVASADRLRAIARSARLPGHDAIRLPGQLSRLTARELEVLRLLAAGRSNGQIAQELFVSSKTASVHVSHIIGKLEVGNRTEAAALAHRHGIT